MLGKNTEILNFEFMANGSVFFCDYFPDKDSQNVNNSAARFASRPDNYSVPSARSPREQEGLKLRQLKFMNTFVPCYHGLPIHK